MLAAQSGGRQASAGEMFNGIGGNSRLARALQLAEATAAKRVVRGRRAATEEASAKLSQLPAPKRSGALESRPEAAAMVTMERRKQHKRSLLLAERDIAAIEMRANRSDRHLLKDRPGRETSETSDRRQQAVAGRSDQRRAEPIAIDKSVARKLQVPLDAERDSAAVKLQAVARGHSARKRTALRWGAGRGLGDRDIVRV